MSEIVNPIVELPEGSVHEAQAGDYLITEKHSISDIVRFALSQARGCKAEIQYLLDHIDVDSIPLEETHDKGPWTVPDSGACIESDDFFHDVTLHISGDFYSTEQRKAYADNLAAKLNATTLEK